MAEQFYTILTKVGKAKIANAAALGTKVNLTKFQVGDGNGSYYNPTEDETQLRNKVWESNISSITIDENNPNWIVLETVIPGDVGGFMIREAAAVDDEGNMIAVGKYPETYKPQAQDGSTKDLIIKMILEVSNTSSVTLKVDPTVILATQKDIQVLNNKIENIKVPVTSVNKKTGDIELTAEDIKTSSGATVEAQLADLASQEVGKGASLVGLNDSASKFTATNVEGAMLELFTNVSSGKDLVGGAITDVDDSVVIPTDPTFGDLASAIGEISTGKKWASGSANTLRSRSMTFELKEFATFTPLPSFTTEYFFKVDGLSFKPSAVFLTANNNFILGSLFPTTTYESYNFANLLGSGKSGLVKVDPNTDLKQGSFQLPHSGNSNIQYNWIAFE